MIVEEEMIEMIDLVVLEEDLKILTEDPIETRQEMMINLKVEEPATELEEEFPEMLTVEDVFPEAIKEKIIKNKEILMAN